MSIRLHFTDGTDALIPDGETVRPYRSLANVVDENFVEVLNNLAVPIALAPVVNLNYTTKE